MNMRVRRHVWIRRSTGSATLVSCLDDALVDELRNLVILKFANSLGRRFDSPDIVITITPRLSADLQAFPERRLKPDEVLSLVLDAYYPGGQTMEEALIIDVSTRRPDCCQFYLRPDEYSSYLSQMSTLAPGTSLLKDDAQLSSTSGLTIEEAPSLLSYGVGWERERECSPGVLRQAYNSGGKSLTIFGHFGRHHDCVHRSSYIYSKSKMALPFGSDRTNATSTSSRGCNTWCSSWEQQGFSSTSSVRQAQRELCTTHKCSHRRR
jgi:hypothetical protein